MRDIIGGTHLEVDGLQFGVGSEDSDLETGSDHKTPMKIRKAWDKV